MNVARRQRGFGMVGWFIVIAVAAFFLMIVFKLFPVYMEHFAVAKSMETLSQENEEKSVSEVRSTLLKRWGVNNVHSVGSKNIEIERGDGVHLVTVAYEVRLPFAYNVDLLVSFEDKAEVPSR